MLFKYLLTSQSATDQERLHFSVQLQPYLIFTKSAGASAKPAYVHTILTVKAVIV